VLYAVEAVDLKAFFAGYRDDGWGRAAHDPAMTVALLLYAYATGDRLTPVLRCTSCESQVDGPAGNASRSAAGCRRGDAVGRAGAAPGRARSSGAQAAANVAGASIRNAECGRWWL
jgi:hypothetical protein